MRAELQFEGSDTRAAPLHDVRLPVERPSLRQLWYGDDGGARDTPSPLILVLFFIFLSFLCFDRLLLSFFRFLRFHPCIFEFRSRGSPLSLSLSLSRCPPLLLGFAIASNPANRCTLVFDLSRDDPCFALKWNMLSSFMPRSLIVESRSRAERSNEMIDAGNSGSVSCVSACLQFLVCLCYFFALVRFHLDLPSAFLCLPLVPTLPFAICCIGFASCAWMDKNSAKSIQRRSVTLFPFLLVPLFCSSLSPLFSP